MCKHFWFLLCLDEQKKPHTVEYIPDLGMIEDQVSRDSHQLKPSSLLTPSLQNTTLHPGTCTLRCTLRSHQPIPSQEPGGSYDCTEVPGTEKPSRKMGSAMPHTHRCVVSWHSQCLYQSVLNTASCDD